LKAVLRLVGIEPPNAHDVGPILLSEKERFHKWFQEYVRDAVGTLRWLRSGRAPSMYGDEGFGLSPAKLL